MDATSVVRLRPLLSELRLCLGGDRDPLAALPRFLDRLRACSFGVEGARADSLAVPQPDPAMLAGVLETLAGPLKAAEEARIDDDLWSAAMLRRDEVRNAAVLAWLLNPNGRHGHGDAVLRDLLAVIRRRVTTFPAQPSSSCSVVVEECPDGLASSRVDIQIDDPQGFFLVIEVKIDAPEQPGQLERYCGIAEARACDGRSWAVVFLTLDGKPPHTAGGYKSQVVPLAWASVGKSLLRLALACQEDERTTVPSFLARAFAAHISTLSRGH